MGSSTSRRPNVGPVGPAGNVPIRTGDWAAAQPAIDLARCNNCLLCWIYCPDGSIVQTAAADGKVTLSVDYEYCKGCGICEQECPRGAISMVTR